MNLLNRKNTTLAVILCLGAGVLCAVLAVWNFRLRAEIASLQKQANAIRSDLQAAHRTPPLNRNRPGAAATPDHQPLPAAGRDKPSTGAAAAPADSRPESKRRLDAEELSAMLRSPMMQKIMASQTSAVMQITYNHLMNHFQLSPEERDYFQRLLVERQNNLQTLGMQFMNPGLSNDDRQALAKKLEEAWTTGESKVRTFLNDDADFAYYQKYHQQEPERKEIGMFEESLGESNALDATTSDALANIQSETRKNFPFTVDFYDQRNFGNVSALNSASVEKFLAEQTEFQSQVAEKAAGLLTPSQLEVYRQNQATVRQMTNMQLNSIVQLAGGR